MTNLKKVRLLRGYNQVELAALMGVPFQALNQYEAGRRNLGPKLLPVASSVLDVSAAYLAGKPQSLPVRDFVSGAMLIGQIVREEAIPDYGVLYLVDISNVGFVSVIVSDGVMFTLSDWQGMQVMRADDIAYPFGGHWVDWRGKDAIMQGGLPRILA